ncbi:18819_t:CDS:2, partial [Gigaspora rosea]
QLLNKDQTDITTWRGKENITKKIPKWFKQIQKRLAEEENSAKGEKETKQNLYTTKMAESSGTLGKKADKLQRCIGCPKNIKRKGCYFKYQKDLLSEVIVDKKKKIHAEISELLGSQMQQIRNVTIREDIQQRVLTRKKPELRNDEDISRSGRGIVKNIQRIETSEN